MEYRIITDFDVKIQEIILAHHYTIFPTEIVSRYKHGRNFHGVVYALSGSATYTFANSAPQTLHTGEIAFIPSNSCYTLSCIDNKPFEHYTINFYCDTNALGKLILLNSWTVLNSPNTTLYSKSLNDIVKLWQKKKAGYRMQTRAHFTSFFSDFLSEIIMKRVEPSGYRQTLPAKKYIEKNFAENITLEQLAVECDLTPSNFRKLFTEIYHQAPISYLMTVRLEKAKEFLLLDYSLETIAQMTGFSDANYFIRFFKKKTGMTPGQFRRNA